LVALKIVKVREHSKTILNESKILSFLNREIGARIADFFPTIQLPEKPNTSVYKELADSTISDASEIQHDKWWIFAIVLAVVALAAILIKLNIA
jgi:hypothetical protein